ncbi:hypothetical protein HaLaN_07725 [Haematococcus lacustris]|uniref:Uncharacterized protein n=1 Tax=Haematococcus lacustris TaxID=44745 RepID=A0A699YP93_HAELA|nr:hypothetical protein HaLaN_07725 [Haematococcus lacustris]
MPLTLSLARNWEPGVRQKDEDLVLDGIDVDRSAEGVLYGTWVTCSRGSGMDPIEAGEL